MNRPVYAAIPFSVQSQSMGSNIHVQQPSFLANNSVGANDGSNLEYASNTNAPQSSYSSDHLPSQFQPVLGIGQLSLNQSAAEYRSSILSHGFFPQSTGYYIRVHTQAFPFPGNVSGSGIRSERSQFANPIPARDLSSFLNLTNVPSTMLGGYPGVHPYEFSRELWYQTSSNSHHALPINVTAADFGSNGEVYHAPNSSIPGANNPNFLWDQPGTSEQTNVAEPRSQFNNTLLHHQPANNMNYLYYGSSQSRVIRPRRHLDRRNSGPYSCPKCKHEFAFSPGVLAHMREHNGLEAQTNLNASSTSKMINSDSEMLQPTRSPFPPMSLNDLNRADGISKRRLSPSMAPETSVRQNHPTDLAPMQSSSGVGVAARARGKEVMTSEQASLGNNAPSQMHPVTDMAGKDKFPCIIRSIKEE